MYPCFHRINIDLYLENIGIRKKIREVSKRNYNRQKSPFKQNMANSDDITKKYLVEEDPDKDANGYSFKKNGTTATLRFIRRLGSGGMASVFLYETASKDCIVLRIIRGHEKDICSVVIESIEQVRGLNGHGNIAEIHEIYFYEKRGDYTIYMTMV